MRRLQTRRIGAVVLQWTVSFAVVTAFWAWVVAPRTSRVFMRGPDEVWDRLWRMMETGEVTANVDITVRVALAGLLVGTILGMLVAALAVLSHRVVERLVESGVVAVYAAPRFVFIPILFIWIGNSFFSRFLLVAVGVFAITFVNTVSGIRTVDPDLVRNVQRFGASRWQVATKVLLRYATGYVTTALTFVASYALLVAIGAEILFGSTDGLGGRLTQYANRFDAGGVLAMIVVATGVTVVLIGAAKAIGRTARWANT